MNPQNNAPEAARITMPPIPGVDYNSSDWPQQWLAAQSRSQPPITSLQHPLDWEERLISSYSNYPTSHALQFDPAHSLTADYYSIPDEPELVDDEARAHWLALTRDIAAPRTVPIDIVQPEFEEYSYPPSDSGTDDSEILPGQECGICMRREARIRFRGCVHASCENCIKGMWRARKKEDAHFPEWFPCHMCRHEVTQVGKVKDGEELEWMLVLRWMEERSWRVWRGLRE